MKYIAYILFRLGTTILQALPPKVARVAVYLLLRVSNYRSKVIDDNLAASFSGKTEIFYTQTRYAFYKNLSKVIVSQVRGAAARDVSYNNIALLHKLINSHGTVILLGSHYGCWETIGKAITPLLSDYEQFVAYKQVKNKYINNYILSLRSDTPAVPVEMKYLYKTMLGQIKGKKRSAFYLIADQYPSALQNIIQTKFLNQTTNWVNGPEKLATKLGVPIVFLDTEYGADGAATVTLVPVYDPAHGNETDTTATYANLLERQIQRSPAHWLWSHKRWKNIR